MSNKPLVFQAIDAARPEFEKIVAANQSGLDSDMEFQYINYIVETFGEAVYNNMDANSVFWGILNQATIGLSVEEGLSHATFLHRFDFTTNYFVLEYMPTYHGLIHLAFESGEMAQITADQVFNGDHFRYNGSRGFPEHHSNGNFASGDLLCAYAVGETKNGQIYCEALSKEELDEIEMMAAMNFGQNDSVWNSAFVGQMRKKSAIRRMMRLMFNQLGFDKPHYRTRIKAFMSVEDNMWQSIKSSMGNEIARAKREKELLNSGKDAVPVNSFGQTVKNETKHYTPCVVTKTGVSASDLIASVSTKNEVVTEFKPNGAEQVEDNDTGYTPVDAEVSTSGFLHGWGY